MANDQPKPVRPWSLVKAALIAIAGYLIAAGFDFKTPAARFAEQDARISRNSVRVDTLEVQMRAGFTVLFKLACVDKRYSDRDRQLAGLDCEAVLRSPRGGR